MEIYEPITLCGGMGDGRRLTVRAAIPRIVVPIIEAQIFGPIVIVRQNYRRRSIPGADGYAVYDYEDSQMESHMPWEWFDRE
jgi:hypothetical protein